MAIGRWVVAAVAVSLAAGMLGCSSEGDEPSVDVRLEFEPQDDESGTRIVVGDLEYRAAQAGELPADGVGTVGGVEVPAGHGVEMDPDFATDPDEIPTGPVMWVTDDPVDDEAGDLWSDLAEQFPETGLWPLVLEPLTPADRSWWNDGELDPTAARQPDEIGDIDVQAELAAWWAADMPSQADFADEELGIADALAPFDLTFPGMAPDRPADELPPDVHVEVQGSYVGLVAVTRPADAIAVIGWLGPLNYHQDVGPLAALLRSWEDRYDAVPVALGFDTLSVVARRPPRTPTDALALTAEHFAAAPDNIWQDAGTIQNYATHLEHQHLWQFWWD